ncbi:MULTISPECIES: SRPBCC family protein [unclassified Sphingobacterium]|uniref:SRPBCC family protein n=1 Tax=unclassified Sphingobacterium TaxID=2609468 RepID=UPI0025CD12B1|nr:MULTISPECIES: SRPBCC family protein [unclassified Sphingobacterium]
MPTLILDTIINAPLTIVFDLARSIDLHMYSTKKTKEKAIAGVTSGLIEAGQTVQWRAKHLGVYQTLTVRITKMEKPYFFEDKMIQGAFQSMDHQHLFEEQVDGTVLMRDVFHFRAPLGLLGRFAEWSFLTVYMKRFLEERNRIIKVVAESGDYIHYC